MAFLSGKIWNFKNIEHFEFNPNGESCFIIGDSRQGKTNVLWALASSVMIKDFPSEPLMTGKEKGGIEFVWELNGKKYTIKRLFTNKNGEKTRFTVIDDAGVGYTSLENLLHSLFGKAFTTIFDINEYFVMQRSPQARFDYMMKIMGGAPVIENVSKIRKLKLERGHLGTEKERYKNYIEHSTLNPESFEENLVTYAEEKTIDLATQKKQEILLKRKSITGLIAQLQIVKEGNEAFELSVESLADIEVEILELQEKLSIAKEQVFAITEWQKNNPNDPEEQIRLTEELATAEEVNNGIEIEADEAFNTMMVEINDHNIMKQRIDSAVENYDRYVDYANKWEEKDDAINNLVAENKKIFSEKLPIPGMTVEEVDDKSMIMYDGREFAYENLSTGQRIRLAMEIQMCLNPEGFNMLIVPEAQSLGSDDMDSIQAECAEMKIQVIMEVTKRKQKLKVVFDEDSI